MQIEALLGGGFFFFHLCEAVQRGLRSSTYDRGRYSVKRENGVHRFHSLLVEFLETNPRSEQR